MRTVFDITNDQIQRLTPQEAVDLFQRLLWAEASRTGVGINNVNISRWIDVPDGGIDASVQEVPVGANSGLLRPGLTGYQIKAGTSFKPWQPARIKKELFGKKAPARENLGSSVRNCLDVDGTYVLVCFGHDLNNEQHPKSETNIRTILAKCGYSKAKVEVWSINQLIGFMRPFPSLCLRINGLEHEDFQSHKSWSNNSDMRPTFFAGKAQEDFVNQVREVLRYVDEPIHVRASGDPGIGKTRLILEATSVEDLAPLVVYCDSPAALNGTQLLTVILKTDSPCYTILVVDECDQADSSSLWNKLQNQSPRIKLVTIFCDYEPTSGATKHLPIPKITEEELSNIIQSYRIEPHIAGRWTEYCSGSPRVAHIVGQNMRDNPEDLMRSPDHVAVWQRYIAGMQGLEDSEVRRKELVLRTLALFKHCGFEGPVKNEARIVGRIAEKIDPQLTIHEFRRIIRKLRSRGIVKGSSTIHISPKLLHVKLWGDWWDAYGEDYVTILGPTNELPAELRNCFYDMFEYGAGFTTAHRIARGFLAEDGKFRGIQDLEDQENAHFFSKLVSADPEGALNCLKRTVGVCSIDELKGFVVGRREVIWGLQKIAVWQEHFTDASKLLLRLAEAENETWSNNASEVYADLFTPAPGLVAPTEASPQERFPLLVEAMNSNAKETRLLAIGACEKALESDHFSRFGTPHHQGLQPDAQLWMPATWAELFDYYRQVWNLLGTRLDTLPDDERDQAFEIMINKSESLIRFRPLADVVAETLEDMASKPYIKRKKLLHKITNILYREKSLRPNCRSRLEHVKERLIGDDFSSLLRRHVGMTVIEDYYDNDGNTIDTGRNNIANLAQQAASATDMLNNELAWLVTSDAENAYVFGYELAQRDSGYKTLPLIIEAYCGINGGENKSLLSGYLSRIFETDPVLWERQLESLAQDRRINRIVPEITANSGASDDAALRILRLVESGVLEVTDCWVFSAGSFVETISEQVFERIIEVLLADPSSFSASTSLDLVISRCLRRNSDQKIPEELTYNVLTHPGFFRKPESARRGQMDEFRWKVVAMRFAEVYPVRSLELADKMLKNMGKEGSIMEGFHPYPEAVLDKITEGYPIEIWGRLTEYLVFPSDRRSLAIASWLQVRDRHYDSDNKRDAKTAIELIPVELIWEWIDEDVEQRAWFFAYLMVPKRLSREKGRMCLAREMLEKYGHLEPVRRNFGANYTSGGWWGPSSLHWTEEKQKLEAFKKTEDNQTIIQWVNEQIAWFDEEIERARIEEERGIW